MLQIHTEGLAIVTNIIKSNNGTLRTPAIKVSHLLQKEANLIIVTIAIF